MKKREVMKRYDLDEYSKVFAYGDTPEDLAMLDIADEKYMNWSRV